MCLHGFSVDTDTNLILCTRQLNGRDMTCFTQATIRRRRTLQNSFEPKLRASSMYLPPVSRGQESVLRLLSLAALPNQEARPTQPLQRLEFA